MQLLSCEVCVIAELDQWHLVKLCTVLVIDSSLTTSTLPCLVLKVCPALTCLPPPLSPYLCSQMAVKAISQVAWLC